MNVREKLEAWEHEYLCEYAAFSDQSKGRDIPEDMCDVRTIYQRDRDRIIHSKSFRRAGWTAVRRFICPDSFRLFRI